MNVVGVLINKSKKVYYFLPNKLKLKKNVTVIVETEKGLEFGKVELENFEINDSSISSPLKRIVRIASKDDYNRYKKNEKDEKKALSVCKELIKKHNLNMMVLDAHYTFEKEQLIFRFLSDSRIDFRDLAKELASKFRTRIELHQIGARDKAKEIGGCGQCGQQLCCGRFLMDLDSVSINMAKNQNLALNPNKINGLCGRLYCCLGYENDIYSEYKKDMPTVGKEVKTEMGTGKVLSVDILNRSYKVDLGDKGILKVSCDDNGKNK